MQNATPPPFPPDAAPQEPMAEPDRVQKGRGGAAFLQGLSRFLYGRELEIAETYVVRGPHLALCPRWLADRAGLQQCLGHSPLLTLHRSWRHHHWEPARGKVVIWQHPHTQDMNSRSAERTEVL